MTDRSDALVAAVEPVLADLGLDLYDLELAGRGPTQTLRVMIDRRGGGSADHRSTESSPATATKGGGSGIDLDAITAATEAISPVLDNDPAVASLLRASYTLEVTSPGLERPLRTPAHFRRALGATVSVKTGVGSEASRRRGVLTAADDAGFDLELDDATHEHVAYDDVIQARTVFEWGPERKATTKGRGRKQKVSP
jgi:ribosome maturation factor RimP